MATMSDNELRHWIVCIVNHSVEKHQHRQRYVDAKVNLAAAQAAASTRKELDPDYGLCNPTFNERSGYRTQKGRSFTSSDTYGKCRTSIRDIVRSIRET